MTAIDAQLLDIETLLQGDLSGLERSWDTLPPEQLRKEIERYRNAIIAVGNQLSQLGEEDWSSRLESLLWMRMCARRCCVVVTHPGVIPRL